MRKRIAITIVGILAAAALVAVPTASAATNVHTATLKGSAAFPAVTGKAKFRSTTASGSSKPRSRTQSASPVRTVRFRVDGVLVGTAKVSSLGTARINKSGSVVPAVHTGSTIRVRRASNGALVASGRFS